MAVLVPDTPKRDGGMQPLDLILHACASFMSCCMLNADCMHACACAEFMFGDPRCQAQDAIPCDQKARLHVFSAC